MPLQTGSQSDLGYRLETTYGVSPTGTLYKAVRRKSAAGLNLTKDSYDSEEVRPDRQLIDSRHGVRRAGGDVETEVSPNSYDDFLIALLGSAAVSGANNGWTLGSGVTYSGNVDFVVAGPLNILNLTGATDFKTGDRITVGGAIASVSPPNGGEYTIIGATASPNQALTVDRAVTSSLADAGVTVTVTGKYAIVGSTPNSFTLERAFKDIDKYQAYKGMRVNSAAFSLPPTGLAMVTWNFLGQNATELTSAPISTIEGDYTEVSPNSVLAAVNGVLAIKDAVNGSRTLGVVTELTFTVDNQLGGSEVVGRNFIPEILWGNTQMITGKVTVLFEDEKLYNLFEGESEASLVFRMDGPTDQAGKFLQFTFPRCKFNTGNIGDAVATGLPVEMEFRALKPRSSDTTLRQSQIVVQTSL
jgi:hypothetical protein